MGKLRYIAAGFFVSFMFAWGSSAIFLDSHVPFQWNSDLKRFAIEPGSIVNKRSEGWGTSHIGTYDIPGISDITEVAGPKIAIWGDSFVEAFQVDDNKKLSQVLTRLLRENGLNGPTAFGVGHSGDNLIDYYFSIPKYEKLINGIKAHFILIGSISDVFLEQSLPPHGVFRTNPAFHMVEGVPFEPKTSFGLMKSKLHSLCLDFLLEVNLMVHQLEVRLIPSKQQVAPLDSKNKDSEGRLTDIWAYFLSKLRDQTKLPIVFVYCPDIPRIVDNHIECEDKNSDIVKAFREMCLKHGISLIDMTKVFCDFHERTKKFPRGFANSRPAEGHLNADGHRLIAERLSELSESR